MMKGFCGKRLRKSSMLSIRITKSDKEFLRGMNLSPTKLFDGALLRIKRRK